MANVWENAVITNKGIALQAKMLAGGKSVKITSVKSGSGSVQNTALMNQENVSGIKQTLTLKPLQKINHTVILTAMLKNDGVTSAYDLRQVGFYAMDPDEGEILYMIAQNTESRHIPTEAEVPGYSLIWNFHFTLSNGVNIEVNVDPAGNVNEAKLEERLSRLDIAAMTGETIVPTDSMEAPLYGLSLFGKSTQDGTPTPDAPVDIVSVGVDGNIKVRVCGKNLLKNTLATGTINGIVRTINADGSITISGTANQTHGLGINSEITLPDGKYILTGAISNVIAFNIWGRNVTTSEWVSFGTDYGTGLVFEADHTKYSAYLAQYHVPLNSSFSNTTLYPMIRVATSTDAAYEKYKEQQSLVLIIPNGLHGIPVDSNGNYTDQDGQQWICDEVDLEKGVYVQRIGHYILNGSENWSIFTGNGVNQFYFDKQDLVHISGQKAILSTHYIPEIAANRNGNYGIIYTGKTGTNGIDRCSICINTLECTTVNEWKTKLAENPVAVQYVLAEPIETPLTAAEIEAYKALHTNYPYTTILNDSNAGMIVKYATSEIGVRVAEIEGIIANLYRKLYNRHQLVSSLPSNPDDDTYYYIPE